MRILTSKAFHFTKPINRKESKVEGQPAATPDSFVWVKPGIPTDVPDWVRQDAQFQRGTSTGSIMEVVAPVQTVVSEQISSDDTSKATRKKHRAEEE